MSHMQAHCVLQAPSWMPYLVQSLLFLSEKPYIPIIHDMDIIRADLGMRKHFGLIVFSTRPHVAGKGDHENASLPDCILWAFCMRYQRLLCRRLQLVRRHLCRISSTTRRRSQLRQPILHLRLLQHLVKHWTSQVEPTQRLLHDWSRMTICTTEDGRHSKIQT